MAQTIAMQRGTSSIATGSNITLFTQSSGTATRVICNWISFYAASQYANGARLSFNHSSSAGGSAQIGYAFLQNAGQSSQITPANNSVGPYQFRGDTTPAPINGFMYAASTASYTGAINPANLQIYNPTSVTATQYMPSNLWMGPSDSLTAYWVDNGNAVTINIAWSFTTITES